MNGSILGGMDIRELAAKNQAKKVKAVSEGEESSGSGSGSGWVPDPASVLFTVLFLQNKLYHKTTFNLRAVDHQLHGLLSEQERNQALDTLVKAKKLTRVVAESKPTYRWKESPDGTQEG